MLLTLVNAEYRFMWIDCGLSGSCSDEQIFNRSDLREKIEDGSLGLPAPEPLGEGGPGLHYFLLADDTFALMPWMVKPYSRRQLTREERLANYRISRGWRVVENAFGILVVHMPNENYRNPLMEAKHQREPTSMGAEAGTYHSFSGLLSVLFRTTQ